MFKKILIPLDGSPLAELAFAHLALLPASADAEIVLVQVVELYQYALATDSITAVNVIEQMNQGAKNYLDEQCKALQKKGFRASYQVREGTAANSILAVAQGVEADLIMMTTRGRSGIARWTLGSVAEQVIHGATMPILLVRGETSVIDHPIQRILLPLDGSDLAEQVLPVAQYIAKKSNAQIMLLQVIPTLDTTNKKIIYGDEVKADSVADNHFLAVDRYLHQKYQAVQAQGISCDYKIRVDDPADEICNLVEKEDIDLIIISTHGRSGIGRWVYGSVANKVLRHTDRPLLLVRS